MKSYLQDIVQHTYNLDINLVMVTGTDKDTIIKGYNDTKTIILNEAKFKTPLKEFEGTFGMPGLNKLNTILNIPEYEKDAKITITSKTDNNETIPTGIHFENASGDFINDFRFMNQKVINEKLKSFVFNGVNWHVNFVPSVMAIQRLKFQAQANNDRTTFIAKTDKSGLKFYFGDLSTHAGDFVFESSPNGNLTRFWEWPVAEIIKILNLSGDKTYRISNDGASMITVDSGLIEYSYIIPALTK